MTADERIEALEKWLTVKSERWQVFIRRMESTGEFVLGFDESPALKDRRNFFGKTLAECLEKAERAGYLKEAGRG